MTCKSCGKEIPDISAFCLHCGRSVKLASGRFSTPTRLAVALGGLLVLVAALLLYSRMRAKPSFSGPSDLEKELAAPSFYPISEKLFTGQLAIGAGRHIERKLVIDPAKMINARVSGTFHASGGSSNDIQVVLVEENEFANWINGHEAHPLYSTRETTNGTVDVHFTKAGTFYLAFSNASPGRADKTVSAEIELDYDALR
jgi:zinc-ribbon domain